MRAFRIHPVSVLIAASLITAVLTTGCRQSTPPSSAATPSASTSPIVDTAAWQSAVDAFIAGYLTHYPTFAANAGKHEFDGKLPDWSAAGLAENARWLHAQRGAIAAFTDDRLDAGTRFQRDYVLSVIDGQLFWLEDSGFAYNNPGFYSGDLSPSMYLTRPYAPLPQRMAAFTTYLEALPKAIGQMRGNFRTPLPASYIDLGVNTFGGYATFFRNDVPAIFAQVDDEALQSRMKTALDAAIQATQGSADWFAAQKPQATQDFAFGADKFAKMLLATERVGLSLDELKAMGEADLARNLAALQAACGQYAAGMT